MIQHKETLPVSLLDELHTSGAGYDILRYVCLPELFRDKKDDLLYYAGRNLARKLDIKTLDDLYDTFDKVGWGRLELVKEKRNYLTFHLKSDAVVLRLKAPFETEFRLEAGFLAEAIEILRGTTCECTENVHHKIHQIEFKVYYTE